MDSRISVPIVSIYTFKIPNFLTQLLTCVGYYDPENHVIYLSDFYKTDSFDFSKSMLHEILHSVHDSSRKHNYQLTINYEEGLNELLTIWLMIKGNFYPNKLDDRGQEINYTHKIRCSGYYEQMKSVYKLIMDSKIDMESVFYNYCINNYEFLSKIIPEKYFETVDY